MSATSATQPVTAPRDKREAIVLAAARAIARSGVRGMRIEEVAATAQVSPALLYYHFESRAGLVRAALEHASEQGPRIRLPRDGGPANGFEAVEGALLGELADDVAVREAAIVWGEIVASAVFEPELRDAVRSVIEKWRIEVAKGIQAGVADGSIDRDVDPDSAANELISLVDGLCTRWLSGALPRSQAQGLLRDALRRSLGPRD